MMIMTQKTVRTALHTLLWSTVSIGAISAAGVADRLPQLPMSQQTPATPAAPSGTTCGQRNTSYTYTSSTTDPDGDQVSYLFDWGDGADSGWRGPYASGAEVSADHQWSELGDYQVRVKAKDIHDNESGWSDALTVCIDEYTIERTLSDGAQRNTIAFDGLAFLTNNLGAQSFLPPGKVADFSGFQYFRDNDPTEMGHNTDFVTIIAFNILNILTQDQIDLLVERAQSQVALINQYAYERFPLMKAFRRLLEGDIPEGCSGLDQDAVMDYSAELYRIDGLISYDRAQLLGGIVRSFTADQRASIDSLKALDGIGHWDSTLPDPLGGLHLEHDVQVAVMTYASEMYSWYAGSVDADTYFCPERQGTYFGSFFLKDWPAMGNPNYTIDEQLTARAGEEFLAVLTGSQADLVTGLVDLQRDDLLEIVETRREISTQLRRFMTEESIDSAGVMTLSEEYGRLDGRIVCNYATHFAEVRQMLTGGQRSQLESLVDSLGYIHPSGAFLYSQPIDMPEIIDTDFLFGVELDVEQDGGVSQALPNGYSLSQNYPNPFNPETTLTFTLPDEGHVRLAVYNILGQEVAVLVDRRLQAGQHTVRWNGSGFPSAVYFYQLVADDFTAVKQMVLLK